MYDPTKPYKKSVLSLIQETWDTPYLSVQKGLYSTFQRKFSHPEIDHIDGIGTKGLYHWQAKTFKEAVQDALAMNLNDLALARATPYKLQNHLVVPGEDKELIVQILQHLANECKRRNIAITGGETSGGEVSPKEEHPLLGLTITLSGFIPKQKQNLFQPGDILFGMKSSGLHSNGFAKVRELFGETVRDEFTIPTRIYDEAIRALDNVVDIHGMMHITGGAFTKLKDVGEEVDIILKQGEELAPQKIFTEIYQKGVPDTEMYQTFNCGIGFVFSISDKETHKIPKDIRVFPLGIVQQGQGKVIITSAFSGKEVVL
tara:strand:- start:610 stop:1557 length:948 start_codon:yes stop_codon:yes gene_type:complete